MYAGQWMSMSCQSSDRIRTPKWGQNLMAWSMDTTIQRMGTGATGEALSVSKTAWSRQKNSCQLQLVSTTACIYAGQCHCFAISSSRIWQACCLELSSRVLLLISKPCSARSSSQLARWKSPLSAISNGSWGGIFWLSRFSVVTWDLDRQYSVQKWSLSRASIACH